MMGNYVDGSGAGWTLETTERFVARCAQEWDDHGFGRFIVQDRQTRVVLGYCGLGRIDWIPGLEQQVELSVRLAPDTWGQGIGTEASRAVLRWCSGRFDRVYSSAVSDNQRSLRLLRSSLGMRDEFTYPYTSPLSGRSATFRVVSVLVSVPV